jgi:hypothetical protein
VRSVKIAPKVTPDDKGLFSWDLVLAPKEKRTLNVEYVVQYPKNYTQSSYPNASNMPPQGQTGSDFQMNALQLQLRSLESKF